MTTGDEAALATAAAAAVAALASWASVVQSTRLQRRTAEPRLHIQVSELMISGGQNRIRLRVENTGGGFAQEVNFWVREGAFVAMGGLPPYGSLGPDQGVTVMTDLTPVARTAQAVVIWRHNTKTYAATGAAGIRKSWSRRKWAFWAPSSNEAVVRRFFPDVGSVDSWSLVAYSLET